MHAAPTTVPFPALPMALALAAALACGCASELASDLDEAQADEIVLALDEAGIGATKERAEGPGDRFRVVVAHEDVAAALAVLRDAQLPRERAPGIAELFAERGLVPSAVEERARQAAATAGELARSIERFEGVTRARVHLALPDPAARPLDEEPLSPRASVLIEHRPDANIDEDAVRALVAGAVPRLAAEDVAVVRTRARAVRSREPHLVVLGPITVTRSSAGALKAILAASFALNLILAAALVLLRARRPAPVARPEPSGTPAASAETPD